MNRAVEAIARGQKRLLLVMATGTGKTYTAFQIVYRLLRSGLRKKILYLADRNILVDQSIQQDFSPLEKTIHKINFAKDDPVTVTSHEVYFSLYQQLAGNEESEADESGEEAAARFAKLFSKDFFDLVIVDECHRGSAKKDSNWRKILEYFSSATQIGMTATPIRKAIVQTTFADANNYMKDGVLLRQVVNVIDDLDLSDYEESHAFGEIYETILKELQSAGSAGEFYTPRAVTDFMAKMIRPKIGEKMADFACGTGGFITSWLKELDKQVKTTEDKAAFGNSIYGIEKKQFPYMLCITNMLLHDLDVPQVFHANSLLRDVLDYTESDQFDVVLMNPPYGGSEKADVKSHFPADLASSETADLFMSVIMYRLKKNGRAAVILPDGFLFGTDNAKVNIKKKLLSEFNLHTVIRMPGSVFSPYTSITTNILFFDRIKPTKETWFYRLDMPEGYKHFSKTKPMKLEHFDPVVAWWKDRTELSEDGFDKAKRFTARQLAEELGYNLDQCGYPHVEEEILAPMDLIQRYQEERSSLNAEIDRVLSEITAKLGGAQ